MEKLKEYEKHVVDERTSGSNAAVSFCGEPIEEWAFTGPSHMVYNAMSKGRILPCKKCMTKILEHIKTQAV